MSETALEVTVLLAIGVGLTLYVLLGGADFGGGVWDLLAHGPDARPRAFADLRRRSVRCGRRTTSG